MTSSIEELAGLIERLKAFNTWRRYDGDLVDVPTMPSPKQIGEDIDAAIAHLSASLHPPVEQGVVGTVCSFGDGAVVWKGKAPPAGTELFTHPPIAGEGEALLPMATAPKDGTKIRLLIEHENAKYSKDPVAEGWLGWCVGSWIEHNGGGWCWTGLYGKQIAWAPLSATPPTQEEPKERLAAQLKSMEAIHGLIQNVRDYFENSVCGCDEISMCWHCIFELALLEVEEAAPIPVKDGQDHSEHVLDMVPPGFVLVPVEPTPEMVAAMAVEEATGQINGVSTIGMAGACLAYESMLAAIAASPVSGEKP